ncbi:hypothetical protein BGX27_003097 [Mortierella sp. AM989]|nr:hypothetical protein BGX27_003097 [Mortierella sp. AM989]
MYKRPYHGDGTIGERTHILPYHANRPPAETPQKIVPSRSPYMLQMPIDTSPRVLPPQPSTSFREVVGSRPLPTTMPTFPYPAVVDTRRPLYMDTTAGSLMTTAERQTVRVAQDNTRPARRTPGIIPRPEIDGMLLHALVKEEIGDWYTYDQQIKTDSAPHSAIRSVTGFFKCYGCEREWNSNGICVEIWMSSTGHQYRTRLSSQTCNNCNIFVEPDVFKDNYVTKVVKVLDGWTGQRSMVKPLQYYPSTGPHKASKCHACRNGIRH